MLRAILYLLIGLFCQTLANKCVTCRGVQCDTTDQTALYTSCEKHISIPYNLDAKIDTNTVDTEYSCLNLVYYNGEITEKIKQCVLVTRGDSPCTQLVKDENVRKCSFRKPLVMFLNSALDDNLREGSTDSTTTSILTTESTDNYSSTTTVESTTTTTVESTTTTTVESTTTESLTTTVEPTTTSDDTDSTIPSTTSTTDESSNSTVSSSTTTDFSEPSSTTFSTDKGPTSTDSPNSTSSSTDNDSGSTSSVTTVSTTPKDDSDSGNLPTLARSTLFGVACLSFTFTMLQ